MATVQSALLTILSLRCPRPWTHHLHWYHWQRLQSFTNKHQHPEKNLPHQQSSQLSLSQWHPLESTHSPEVYLPKPTQVQVIDNWTSVLGEPLLSVGYGELTRESDRSLSKGTEGIWLQLVRSCTLCLLHDSRFQSKSKMNGNPDGIPREDVKTIKRDLRGKPGKDRWEG